MENEEVVRAPSSKRASSMYVVTFYSFKGGVGRTMALVNVAAHLASMGSRVLIVDFDLEAPGLDTIGLGADAVTVSRTRGVVDFVTEYRKTGEVPDVRDFVYDCPVLENNGQIFVMPAGRDDDGYAERLSSISWSTLYEQEDGFVLFEDLKAQWRDALRPDYVLIDSRTGHTDVGGICTRQLPDAVVVVFIPNQQNLRGLERVVQDIRQEENGPREKKTNLHFVISNVPDLDDEERILAGRINAFRRDLQIRERPTIVHRYDSLSLLTQSIFTKDRPRSRLAREYRQLSSVIQRANPADPRGAIDFLERVLRDRTTHDVASIESRLDKIRERHGDNPEILLLLAEVRQRQGRAEEALTLLQRPAASRASAAERILAIAEARRSLGESDAAASDALRIFDLADVDASTVSRALQILLTADEADVSGISTSNALKAIVDVDELSWIASQLNGSKTALGEAKVLLDKARQVASEERSGTSVLLRIEYELGLVHIGLGKFEDATKIFSPRAMLPSAEISDMFNLAMSRWGRDKRPDPEAFIAIAQKGETETSLHGGANFHQCMFIAWWIAGHRQAALANLHAAHEAALNQGVAEFSCWRYMRIALPKFLEDLSEMKTAARREEALYPPFIYQP
ncbi:MAG TPA: ParA family protein [Gemmatimonas sp.]|uniref:ParA family protein n=1 Tax=Gemmatimonas sp. TaxID=1962908 RepID=UPI002ED9D8F0